MRRSTRVLLAVMSGLLLATAGSGAFRSAAAAAEQATNGRSVSRAVPGQSYAGQRHIAEFDSTVAVAKDGSASITEVITYDFASEYRHGIDRIIPTIFAWTGEDPKGASVGAQFERVTPIDNIEVSGSSGTPVDLEVSETSEGTQLRIGDANQTITGVHTYTIRYTLAGVLNGFTAYDELYLNITGNNWTVPISETNATVTMPGSITRVACYFGPNGSTAPCPSADSSDSTARFAAGSGSVGDGMTIVVAVPKGVVTDPATTRILKEKWSLARAFRLTPTTGGLAGGLLATGLGGISMLLWRHGRDRRFVGSATDVVFGNDTGEDQAIPLGRTEASTVEFVPPDGIHPGHMGTLWDEQANHLDVSAMIVDLAVRGWLRIDELATDSRGFGFANASDYQFVKLREIGESSSLPPALQLWRAEEQLLAALFRDGSTSTLSGLRQHFAERLALVESSLYDDVVAAGWFPSRPDQVRARWLTRGLALLAVGVGLVWLAAKYTTFGLVASVVPICGFALAASARWFPRRTAKGSALLSRVRGFKELFDAGEGERQRFAEQHHIFAQYLPYAMVFGCTERWAETFASLGLSAQEMGLGVWYTSPYGYDPIHFGYAMGTFSTYSTGSLAAATPSSVGGAASGGSGFGGGFSGGGFGGGGGGDW